MPEDFARVSSPSFTENVTQAGRQADRHAETRKRVDIYKSGGYIVDLNKYTIQINTVQLQPTSHQTKRRDILNWLTVCITISGNLENPYVK